MSAKLVFVGFLTKIYNINDSQNIEKIDDKKVLKNFYIQS